MSSDKSNVIAFQGVAGAYSDMACRAVHPEMTTLPCDTFEDTFAAVRDGKAVLAMIPIENSSSGRVADIHHLLPDSGLHIIAEHFQGTMETISMAVDDLADPLDRGSELITRALLEDRKIVACGIGVDAALAHPEISASFTTRVLGSGCSRALTQRQHMVPRACPQVVSQLSTPGSSWASTTRTLPSERGFAVCLFTCTGK